MSFLLTITKSSVSHSWPVLRNGSLSLESSSKSLIQNRCYTDTAGSAGSGKGGREAGSVKESGGGLAQFGTAQEEVYFRLKQQEELEKIKKQLKENPELQLKKKDDEK